ncbi:MAG TPA: hypothetical protein VKX17_08305 [Planctomycetota bacterium]|nr:hypothetical protein [Planctomycetota bacterium]
MSMVRKKGWKMVVALAAMSFSLVRAEGTGAGALDAPIADLFGIPILRRLNWPDKHHKNEYWVFENPDGTQYKQIWKDDGGKEADLPKVDFTKETVIALFIDSKKTHGHRIKIEKVFECGDAEAQLLGVLYRETAEDTGTVMPNDVVVIKGPAMGKDTRFEAVEMSSTRGKELLAPLKDLKQESKK